MQHETIFKTNLFNNTLRDVTFQKPNHKVIIQNKNSQVQ